MASKYKLFPGSDGQWYFRLQGGNNEPLLQSEGYTTKDSAKNGIDSVCRHSPTDANYERINSPHIWFRLKASNGQIIGKSETYSSTSARETGIAAVKKNGPIAPVEE